VIQVLAGRFGFRFTSHHYAVIAAGPWSFPAPSSALPVTRRALEGPDRAPSSSRFTSRRLGSSPSTFVFAPLQSFADLPRSVLRPSSLGIRPVQCRCEHRCPSVRCPTRSPLHRHAPWRPLPARRRAFGPGSTRPRIPFRPRGFAPPRRFSPPSAPKRVDLSVRESRACCIPLPIVGFIAFLIQTCCCQPAEHILATLAPLEGFPSRTAGPCLHGLLPS
jgi:hypothetical protein